MAHGEMKMYLKAVLPHWMCGGQQTTRKKKYV